MQSVVRRRGAAGRGDRQCLALVLVAPAEPTVLGSLFDPAGAPDQWPVGRFTFAVRAGDWARWWTVVVMPEHVATR